MVGLRAHFFGHRSRVGDAIVHVAVGYFSLYGGVLADRLPKRRVIAWAQMLNCAATLVMALIIFSGNVKFWDFIWFGFFNGTVLALSMPARRRLCQKSSQSALFSRRWL